MKPHPHLPSAAHVAGCVVGVGNSEDSVHPGTVRELPDLLKARDSGAITEEEFERQCTRILNRRH